jgi:hypothetical protein
MSEINWNQVGETWLEKRYWIENFEINIYIFYILLYSIPLFKFKRNNQVPYKKLKVMDQKVFELFQKVNNPGYKKIPDFKKF